MADNPPAEAEEQYFAAVDKIDTAAWLTSQRHRQSRRGLFGGSHWR